MIFDLLFPLQQQKVSSLSQSLKVFPGNFTSFLHTGRKTMLLPYWQKVLLVCKYNHRSLTYCHLLILYTRRSKLINIQKAIISWKKMILIYKPSPVLRSLRHLPRASLFRKGPQLFFTFPVGSGSNAGIH